MQGEGLFDRVPEVAVVGGGEGGTRRDASGGHATAKHGDSGWTGVETESDHRGRCDQLHRQLKRIVKARGSLDLQEAAALREAQQIQMWRPFGFSSLLEYMELELGYSPRAALERLRVANALPQLPQIAAAIEQGDLSFSGARELTRVATPETEQKWLGATVDMNLREVEAAVSGHTKGDLPTDAPDPKLQRKILRFEVRLETDVLFREAKRKLEKERGERVDEDSFIASLCRSFLNGSLRLRDADEAANDNDCAVGDDTDADAKNGGDGVQQTGEEQALNIGTVGNDDDSGLVPYNTAADARAGTAPYRIALTQCKDCKRAWMHGAGSVALVSTAEVERALCDAQHIGDVNADKPARAKQSIPPAIRRLVLQRDQGRCQVPGCRATCNIDLHHLLFLSQGGTHAPGNLITLCEAHHLALHKGALVILYDEKTKTHIFKREGGNNFTLATRAVEAAKALSAEGVERERVRLAIARAKTHVGTEELALPHWIDIARRYIPECE